MYTRIARRACVAVGLLLLQHQLLAQEAPLGTVFTYQGRLKDGGSPANGTYDVRFALCDQLIGGTQQGPTVCADDVGVAGGLFTVELDFGAQFTGQERFLEIAVRTDTGLNCANPAGFVTLSPRQALTAAPNALFALNADQLDGLDSSAFLQSIPVPLTLSGTSATHIIRGNNSSNSSQTVGVFGQTTGTGGGFGIQGQQRGGAGVVPTVGAGVFGTSNSGIGTAGFSNTGDAMYAITLGASGVTHGLTAESRSTSGIGVRGTATAATGTTYGVYGQSDSSAGFAGYFLGRGNDALYVRNDANGRGIQVLATNDTALWASTTAGIAGVDGRNASTSGRGVYGYATAVSGENYGVYGRTSSTEGRGVYGTATAASGATYGGYFGASSPDGRGVYGAATVAGGLGAAVGGHFESNSADGNGVFGRATHASGFNFGGRFETDSSFGNGVFGWARAASGPTYGVAGTSTSTSGRGVYGRASAGSGENYGVYGESLSSGGFGVYGAATATIGTNYGGYFRSASTSGYGVVGVGSRGVYGGTDSTGGVAVEGYASATSGLTYGVYARSFSSDGRGVYGWAEASSGSTYGGRFGTESPNGRGVYGHASATGANDTPQGVRGYCSTASSGYAVYASGDTGASGTKSFRIDHPFDPENKYLLHYSAESPEVINFYSGKATLDERGEAVVELPAYFASINKDPRYTLTAVGAAMPMLHVAEEISEEALEAGEQAGPGVVPPICSFRIAGGVPSGKVSWRVEAVRNDLRMRLHGAPVEREKSGPERGKYQHPEYYGQPPEMGMDYHPEPAPVRHPEPERPLPPAPERH